ncbi:conserved protein of unknown function [Tepidanaerobacter acetatoxydans Re1]|uniref:UPF0251 protein TEPIRE1_0268 n=1 Tax=Tepidanaerobacter acetatoxydans (strain DSM 21804 / JCM 16047 / Re1) TaxID=1209989 RepID=F4LTC5_TEPAE|nr:DUF134 domain-containing protein [Tepidanaerobacter acetatoxydans]AEE90456.1 UPF0251 protein [Tepidanaerobacter acetatoxydans Re1]CCP24950.1 conserved protein of unknown function [Tepidanaerobacter acetatoxydans Re1]
MARPPKWRHVEFIPDITYFKPAGVPLRQLDEVVLTVEELEALRLKDLEGLEQEPCAERMNISRPTFIRIINSARTKVAEALVKGKAIRIEGGTYQFVRPLKCWDCGNEWSQPQDETSKECPNCHSTNWAPKRMQRGRCHGHNRQDIPD